MYVTINALMPLPTDTECRHQGMYKMEYTPVARGFDTSFGFLTGGEDHYTQRTCCDDIPAQYPNCSGPIDLWGGSGPLRGDHRHSDEGCRNPDGTKKHGCGVSGPGQPLGHDENYNGYTFTAEAVRLIEAHAAADDGVPFFMYYAVHNVHSPIQVRGAIVRPRTEGVAPSRASQSTLPLILTPTPIPHTNTYYAVHTIPHTNTHSHPLACVCRPHSGSRSCTRACHRRSRCSTAWYAADIDHHSFTHRSTHHTLSSLTTPSPRSPHPLLAHHTLSSPAR
jgi:hypothetical protein